MQNIPPEMFKTTNFDKFHQGMSPRHARAPNYPAEF